MKKSISNRDVERIAQHARLEPCQVRQALALRGEVPAEIVEQVMASARALRYTISARDRVAMAANTSVATVNRAYRPDARHLVRPDLLRHIEEEAARLGYTPDLVAQARRNQGSPIVALCVEMSHLFNPYHAQMLFHLMRAVLDRGLHPVITPVTDPGSLPDLAQSGVTSSMVLWEGPHTGQHVRLLAATGRRAVMIGRDEALPSVAPDWSTASATLTRRALEAGYDVLHLGYFSRDRWLTGARLEGVARALHAHDGPWPELRLWTDPGLNRADAAARLRQRDQHHAADLLEHLNATPGALEPRSALPASAIPTELMTELNSRIGEQGQRVALLGMSDITARQLLRLLSTEQPDWQLGAQVGLVGSDNIEPLLGYLDPVLTTVAYDMEVLAQCVADRAAAGDRHRDLPPFATVPTQVIDRHSL